MARGTRDSGMVKKRQRENPASRPKSALNKGTTKIGALLSTVDPENVKVLKEIITSRRSMRDRPSAILDAMQKIAGYQEETVHQLLMSERFLRMRDKYAPTSSPESERQRTPLPRLPWIVFAPTRFLAWGINLTLDPSITPKTGALGD